MELVATGVALLLVFMLGAAIGSFLNVVIYRLPAGLSLLRPPSRCPQCLKQLKAYDNVPVLGWLWLRGRCRFCRSRIPKRYPLIEALTGWLFVSTFLAFGFPQPAIGYWLFVSWLVALAFIDLDTLTLPNGLTQSGLVLGLLFQLSSANSSQAAVEQFWAGVVGAVVGIWLFDLVTIVGSMVFGQTAMGAGDAKLAAMMGAWLGWQLLLLSSFLACVLGAIVGGGGIALGLLSRRQPMPFGPFLAIAAVLCLFYGNTWIALYKSWFFPTF